MTNSIASHSLLMSSAESTANEADYFKMDDRKHFIISQVQNGVYMCRERSYVSGSRANIWVVRGSTSDLIVDTGLGLWDLPGFLKKQGLIGDKPVQGDPKTWNGGTAEWRNGGKDPIH